jgi:ribosomal protection tetracycline resistance protein
MMDYKNIGIFAHVDAGKTTLTEQMLYLCGAIRKAGSVDDGTTQTDSMSIERRRGISVRAANAKLILNDCQINIIDTPGHIDFAGEAERSLSVLDGAVLVVSAIEGVQSHTENLWKAFRKYNLPSVIFVNKIDRAGSNIKNVSAQFLKRLDGGNFLFMNQPWEEGSRACTVRPADNNSVIEKLADFYDDIAEDYINGSEIAQQTIDNKLYQAVCENKITLVYCGSAQQCVGVNEILTAAERYLPSSDVKKTDNLSGLVYKIEHDKDVGKMAYVRMFGGVVKSRDVVKDGRKVTQIRQYNGSKYTNVNEVTAGDIAALCGVDNLKVGDIIGECKLVGGDRGGRLANPFLTVKVTPKTEAELTPLIEAIKELTDEEPLIDYKWEKSEREINLNLTGKIQLEVITALLSERYGLEANFSAPSVIYKETPARIGEGFEAYTMPKPCWAVVHLRFETLLRGKGVIFDAGNVPHNQLFYKYQTHIEQSFFQSLEQGLYGWEVTDFKATLIGGEHHTIHTHPLDFFVATPMAVMNGLSNTGTTLLEPLMKYRITAAEEILGKVISDVIAMRGEFDSPAVINGTFETEAILPVASSLEYPIRLSALSGGKATYSTEFYGYKEIPLELGATAKRRGVNPLDRSKWILQARGAYTE